MRSEKELIQLLIDSEDIFNEYCSGLCYLSVMLNQLRKITFQERNIILKILDDNVVRYSLFNIYYFEPNQWQPRKKYLENLLKKYE